MTRNLQDPESRYGIGKHLAAAALCAVILVGGLGGWAVTAQLNAAILGNGHVKVDRELKVVQHVEGGRVAEIHVVAGQTLAKGDVMVTLDVLDLKTELALRQTQQTDLVARAARLLAQRDGLDRLAPLPGPLTRGIADPARLQQALSEEQNLLEKSQRDLENREAAIRSRMAQLNHDHAALSARQTALESQHDLALKNMARLDLLAARGNVSDVQKEAAQGDLGRALGELQEIRARLQANTEQVSAAMIDLRALRDTAQLQAQGELRDIEPRLAELVQQIGLLEARLERSQIRAPVAGTINELGVHTIGQVIGAGEKLASIVPEGADLVIEFQIMPTDIDQVVRGMPARLRLAAFNQKTTPEIPGVISMVSPASTLDPATGATVFLAQVRPDASLPSDVQLIPGMPVEVFVTTRERTALEYMLQPVRQSFARSMTEE